MLGSAGTIEVLRGRGMQFAPRALADIEVDQSANARNIQMNRFR